MNAEQRHILASKPIWRMRRFAALLNWRGLELSHHILSADVIARLNVHPSGVIVSYMTPDLKFNIQINEHPIDQTITYQATIKAERYGIAHIGWHDFTLFDDDAALKREAEWLRPWLDRKLFKDRRRLREFKDQHPERLMGSRKKSRGRAAVRSETARPQ